jgi:hypothetical protein
VREDLLFAGKAEHQEQRRNDSRILEQLSKRSVEPSRSSSLGKGVFTRHSTDTVELDQPNHDQLLGAVNRAFPPCMSLPIYP